MTDIVERLRGTAFDKDNFPRMKTERACPVADAMEAADEIERLRAALEESANEMDSSLGIGFVLGLGGFGVFFVLILSAGEWR